MSQSISIRLFSLAVLAVLAASGPTASAQAKPPAGAHTAVLKQLTPDNAVFVYVYYPTVSELK
jgi:hypothetical protein